MTQRETVRSGIPRRMVAKGALWATPTLLVATAAPAYAASRPCTYTTSAWATRTSATAATGQNGMTATAVVAAGTRTDTAYPNMGIVNDVTLVSAHSGQGWLQLATGGNNTNGETVTIRFPQPIYCPSFYVTDIDTQYVSASSRYRDHVSVSGFVASTESSQVVVSGGTATTLNTATSSTPGTYQWDKNDLRGLARFSASGPITSISLVYRNTNAGTGTTVNSNNQQVWVSPIRYSTEPCLC